MSNPIAGAVPESATAGQPGQVPQGQGEKPAGEVQTQAPLTLEQVQSAVAQMLDQRDQRTSRALQSQLDKRDANILKRIEAAKQQQERIVKSAKVTGVDPSQAQAMAQAIMNEEIAAILEEQQLAQQAQAQQQPAGGQQQPMDDAQSITVYAKSLISTLGMSEEDPELLAAYGAMQQAKTPDEYIGPIRAAYRAKLQRELAAGGDRQQANLAQMVGLGAEGGQRVAQNKIKDITSPSQLYDMAFNGQ